MSGLIALVVVAGRRGDEERWRPFGPKPELDDLLETSYRLRALALGAEGGAWAPNQEVVIEIEKHSDGTLLVLPAHAT